MCSATGTSTGYSVGPATRVWDGNAQKLPPTVHLPDATPRVISARTRPYNLHARTCPCRRACRRLSRSRCGWCAATALCAMAKCRRAATAGGWSPSARTAASAACSAGSASLWRSRSCG